MTAQCICLSCTCTRGAAEICPCCIYVMFVCLLIAEKMSSQTASLRSEVRQDKLLRQVQVQQSKLLRQLQVQDKLLCQVQVQQGQLLRQYKYKSNSCVWHTVFGTPGSMNFLFTSTPLKASDRFESSVATFSRTVQSLHL